jgi:hypothetical protein
MGLPGQPPRWWPPGFVGPRPLSRIPKGAPARAPRTPKGAATAGPGPSVGVPDPTPQGVPRESPAARGPRERPSGYDHPVAIAARLGRISAAATAADLPDPFDTAQRRAFEIARARSRAQRWGWRSAFIASGRGADNRGQRRHRR